MNASHENSPIPPTRIAAPLPDPKFSVIERTRTAANAARKIVSRFIFGFSGFLLIMLLSFPAEATGAYGLSVIKLALIALVTSMVCGAYAELGGHDLLHSEVDDLLINVIQMRVKAMDHKHTVSLNSFDGLQEAPLFGGRFFLPQLSSFGLALAFLVISFLFR